MTTTIYNNRKKNPEVKVYKMICGTFGFMFKFATDDVNKFMEDYKERNGQQVKGFTYQEA